MKKIFLIIAITTMLFGCSDSFLDKQPEDTLSPGVFFKTPDDIKTGVVAVYKTLQTIFAVNDLPYILEQESDDGTTSYNSSNWNSFTKDNSFSDAADWTSFYKMIVNANNIIDIIDNFTPANDADAVVVKAYKGEACFLRALAYFYLVRLYGDVPMVVKHLDDPNAAFGIGRTPVNDIYNKVIIPDLQYAADNCYKKGDAAIASEGARATKGAALTILGKVYLTMKDNTNAAAALKRLIVDKEAGTYALLADYSKIWLPSNKFNSESIFEVNYNVAAGSPSYYFRNMNYALAVNGYKMSTPGGLNQGEKNLMDEFVSYKEWTRYKATVDSSFTVSNGLICPTPLKLMPPLNGIAAYDKVGTDYNYMITRYADALLMYAEALMPSDPNAAVTYVNMVRARANMAPIAVADLNIYRILHERRMELAFEGHRYFDLVRTGKAIEIISASLMSTNEYEGRRWRTTLIPEYQLILPVPVTEIQIDHTLTQNPGY